MAFTSRLVLFLAFSLICCYQATRAESIGSNPEDATQTDRTKDLFKSYWSRQFRKQLSSRGSAGTPSIRPSVQDAIMSGSWDIFTPPPVVEPNCHIEVQVVQTIPGRCIRLANNQAACQSQSYISLDADECR